jgi:hypothetical protein
MIISDNDLVLIRLPNDLNYTGRQRHYDCWFRVKFIDNDGTFIGKLERIDKYEFTLYKIDDCVSLSRDKVQHVYQNGEQWCYGDGITICNCTGLCREK